MLIIRASIHNMAPQLTGIFYMVDQEFVKVGCAEVVLTSGWRGYTVGSLHHYAAADFDSVQMSNDWFDHKWQALKVALRYRLGDEYDVVVHGPKAHVHIEYQPKREFPPDPIAVPA